MYNFIKVQKLFAKHHVLVSFKRGHLAFLLNSCVSTHFFPFVTFNHFHFSTFIITGPPSLPRRGILGSFQSQSAPVLEKPTIHTFKVSQKNPFRLVFLRWIEVAPSRRSPPATTGSRSGLPAPGSTGTWRGSSYSLLWSRGPACTAAQTERTHNEKTGIRSSNSWKHKATNTSRMSGEANRDANSVALRKLWLICTFWEWKCSGHHTKQVFSFSIQMQNTCCEVSVESNTLQNHIQQTSEV